MLLKDALDNLKNAFIDFEKAVRSDDKTPLQNSLSLNEAKVSFTTSDDSPSVVIFADINEFKSVNDGYGYDVSDATIYEIGKRIENSFVKPLDALAFRQSGDEFVILLQTQRLKEFTAQTSAFESCEVPLDTGKPLSVGVSFGYAVSTGEFDFETVKARAEVACKEAKKQGHGICMEWTKEIERKSLQSLRRNCDKCHSVISCYVPQEMAARGIKLCAVCGTDLS